MADFSDDLVRLTVSREEAKRKLQERVQQGVNLADMEIVTREDLATAQYTYSKWDSYNTELLKRLFSDQSFASEYSKQFSMWGHTDLNSLIDGFRKDVRIYTERLKSIIERLELIPEPTLNDTSVSNETTVSSRDIFIVHGHDTGARESVARFINKLELIPIILHEQANSGRTIIEKLEHETTKVGFVVVLLTPDDLGATKEEAKNLKSRARQNVILELGYFIGKLGRDHVCPLYKSDVELPSDLLGVAYVSMDDNEGWHIKLAREIKAAGFDVDLNKVIS